MYDDINSTRLQLWAKLKGDKPYRDGFVDARVSSNISAQVYSLREARGWTQTELGDRVGMAQTRISLIESREYNSHTLKTLKRFASAFDCALMVRFVPYSNMVDWVTTAGPEELAPVDIEHDQVHLLAPLPIRTPSPA